MNKNNNSIVDGYLLKWITRSQVEGKSQRQGVLLYVFTFLILLVINHLEFMNRIEKLTILLQENPSGDHVAILTLTLIVPLPASQASQSFRDTETGLLGGNRMFL